MVVPQSIAFATGIAGLPAQVRNISSRLDLTFQYGLYSAFFSTFMYFLFGTSRDLTVGPTSILSLIVSVQASKDANGDTVVADALFLAFFGGLLELCAGLFHLGAFDPSFCSS